MSCPCIFLGSLRCHRISSAGPRTSNNPAHQSFLKISFSTENGKAYNLILAFAGKPNWRGTRDLTASKAEVKYYHTSKAFRVGSTCNYSRKTFPGPLPSHSRIPSRRRSSSSCLRRSSMSLRGISGCSRSPS